MADSEEDNSALASFFPDPPLFWKAFIPSNLQAFADLKQQHASQQGVLVQDIVRVPHLPADSDLIYLQPPAEPEDGTWRLYGQPESLEESLQPLESAGIERLGPPLPGSVTGTTTSDSQITANGSQSTTQPATDTQATSIFPSQQPTSQLPPSTTAPGGPSQHTHDTLHLHLKRLSKSLLLNYLELLGIMSVDPAAGSQKASDLRTLFLNFHHVLNEYRPHQAREQLIQLMQERLDQTRAETAANRAVAEKARRVLEGLGSVDIPVSALDTTGGMGGVGGAGMVMEGDGGYAYAPGRRGTVVGDRRVGVDGDGGVDEEGRYWERERMGWRVLDAEFA
ncbi:MED7 protein-domain-containing protein [Copromyces sp. CBS 386.78]|nr:MED7 protein-domain-containing protein [Copromyces sp. CBS 386.78]